MGGVGDEATTNFFLMHCKKEKRNSTMSQKLRIAQKKTHEYKISDQNITHLSLCKYDIFWSVKTLENCEQSH